MPKRTGCAVVTSNIPTPYNSIPLSQTPKLTKRGSPAPASRGPIYHKLNPSPGDWPEPKKVHRINRKALSKNHGQSQKPSSLSSESPSIPPLPAFYPLYPNPHLEPCRFGGLTHVLECGHKVVTPEGPQSCSKNCKVDDEKLQHVNRSSGEMMRRTADTFCCPRCISELLDKKYTKKYMTFVNEMEGIRVLLGYFPERAVEQRRQALQRVWSGERKQDEANLTGIGRPCHAIDGRIEPSDESPSFDQGSTFSINEYDTKRPISIVEGSSFDEGVQLTYEQLLNRLTPIRRAHNGVTENTVKPLDLIDEEDFLWISMDQRVKETG
ncbi:hypothetical protein EV356DRAFT_510016 [Viridothelium virens]|uniref:Uncharacterized protein n=1 Tax=Viridothelium virens TaxID=1048519 RepID=A0A6A6GVU6_VIRVR|nr:hypothetical protein EV356DRAFT_510016 [Viridothelium virens]